jgi:hypothetical protein
MYPQRCNNNNHNLSFNNLAFLKALSSALFFSRNQHPIVLYRKRHPCLARLRTRIVCHDREYRAQDVPQPWVLIRLRNQNIKINRIRSCDQVSTASIRERLPRLFGRGKQSQRTRFARFHHKIAVLIALNAKRKCTAAGLGP